MAQPATNPKIEELRFRLKTDPKSRLFYQLAEELRRSGQYAEAEQVLRQGLVVYPTYLAAWVSLGRVLREQRNDTGAVEALNKALQLDPGNVVAARILADAYLALGETVEAIKKYKLVYALLPADEELRGTIERLDREIHPPAVSAFTSEPEPEPEAATPFSLDDASIEETTEVPIPVEASLPSEDAPMATVIDARDAFTDDSPFDKTVPPFALDDGEARDRETADVEPMLRAHDESPFEEPVQSAMADALAIESPVGIHVEFAPAAAEVPAPAFLGEEEVSAAPATEISAATLAPELDESDVFAPVAPPPAPPAQELTDTLTMADLYARQGLIDDAKTIYEHILARDPNNAQVRAKLAALTPAPEAESEPVESIATVAPSGGDARIERLERWLAKVAKREVRSV
jgi:tetratricopeptide (TPR) repeat protein